MLYEIPVDSTVGHQTFEVELSGASYRIELRWNNRAQAWFISLYSGTGKPLLLGRRLVVNTNILRRHRTPEFPPGDLVAVDTTGSNADPGADEIGKRVKLLYAEG